jgi:transposase
MKKCSDEKKAKIKQSIIETRDKRRFQRCMVFQLKVDYSHLNKSEREALKMFFIEARWIYNHILSQEKPFDYDYKNNKVLVRNKDKEFEERILKYLPAKNKQDVFKTLLSNIRGLSARKKNGGKVGKLKFKSEYNSIELSQYGTTHRITGRNRIRINGIKKPLIVRGLDQIKSDYEFANAKLVKKPSGYYIHLSCFRDIKFQEIPQNIKPSIGLDFGIKTTITTSNGDKYDISIGESERLKRLSRKMNRQIKGSKNRYRTRNLLRKEYEHIANKRQDKANKLVSKVLRENQIVCMQDENIKGWHKGLFGKQVQNSALGTIKNKLIKSKQVILVDRSYPTTKKCYRCGNIVEIGLEERIYNCNKCGLIEDRDVKSAKTALYAGLSSVNSVPVEYRENTPVEIVPLPEDFKSMASTVSEAGSLRIHS